MVRLRPSLRMVSWNPDGFKLGLPPLRSQYANV
jgi:hypothetical protein